MANHPPTSLRRRFLSLPTLVSFALAIGVLFILATQFDMNWTQTWESIKDMDVRMYILGVILYYMSFGFRGLRWKSLALNAKIRDIPGARMPSVWTLSRLIIIGWFVNSVVWLRMGDAYRAWVLSEKTKTDFSWNLGILLAERIVDMTAVVSLLMLGVFWFSMTSDSASPKYILAAAIIMTSLLGVVLALMKTHGSRLAPFLPKRIGRAYESFQRGALGSLERFPYIFALGSSGWFLEMGRLYFVTQSLDISVSVILVLIASLGHAILSTIPTPGGMGAVEPGVTGILMLGLTREKAASIVLLDRSITYLSIIAIGGLIFLIWQTNLLTKKTRF